MKGNITRRGKHWSMMLDLPRDPLTGKRRQKRITARTKNEVEALATQALAAIEAGGFAEADAKKLTVSQYMTRWHESIEGSVKPITYRRYGDLLRLHVLPNIGAVQLSKLSPEHLQRLYANRLSKAGLSPTSVGTIHVILHRALKQAMRWGLLTRNVTEAVDAPRKATPTCATWSQKQATDFLAVADNHDWAALWRLALLTGMRRGELLAVHWKDVDLVRGVLAVRYSYSRGGAGGFVIGQPKTTSGRRSIALPRSVVEVLQKHRVRQVEGRLKLGTSYEDQDLVFTNALGGPLHPNTMALHFHRLSAEAGVPRIRIHDLRHTSATLMLANNVHPKIVQERLGHSDISMTLNRYSHVTMDMQRDAADQMDVLMAATS